MAFMGLTFDRDETGSDRMEGLTVPSPHAIRPHKYSTLFFGIRRALYVIV
jgi:hypothetical protein